MDDVLIIGGSFAGLSSALTLGRARRRVTVLDTGLPRNRYATHAHNVFGHDGKPPHQILDEARLQIAGYETVRLVTGRATTVAGTNDAFRVTTDDGTTHEARRLILGYGVTDLFPDIAGFAQCWGKTVIHCPYCHGYEVAGKRWGLIYSTPMSLHAPTLYADWTDDITLFTDGNDIPDAERSKLDKRGVRIAEGKLRAFEHLDGQLTAVVVENGQAEPMDAVFAHPRVRPSSDIHEQLGLAMTDTPFGQAVKVDETQSTSMEGVFAAGDLATAMHSITLSSYGGLMAAVHAQRTMLT